MACLHSWFMTPATPTEDPFVVEMETIELPNVRITLHGIAVRIATPEVPSERDDDDPAVAWRVHPSMVMHTDGVIRGRLVSCQQQLLRRYYNEIERADEELDARDSEDGERASEQWEARVLLTLSESDARALAEIVGAIKRLDLGTYGTCIRCGTSIAAHRLQVLPAAALCLRCAARAEAG